ncbi:hypothetical protein [Candidatus Mesenet endosymbiont of Phosphuga atrata]|uniref:hypothetical protein n=1 Tax=Candidatus Mesenet endosymbiont of Phosphuga atrata TaxID=3066221 RepID=UPI0030D47C15
MQWSSKSKEAFVQALNIEFLTTTGSYTNFQFRETRNCRGKGQICILFPNGEQEEYQKYLEQVTAKYKGARTSFEKSNFDAKSFPFCMSPGQFSTRSRKFKVPLNKEVINNLYYMFVFQLLSFELDVTNLPNDIDLDEDDKRKGYIVGWAFPRGDGNTSKRKREVEDLLNRYSFSIENGLILDENDTLCDCTYIHKHRADEAVQRAIKDFPTQILRQYPTKLLTLFNVFYHDLSAKEGMSPYCEQFVRKMWAGCVNTAKAQGNIVSFDYYGEDSDEMRDKEHVKEIYNLYEGKKINEIFHNFINVTKRGQGNITVSFNFNLHNINVIVNKVPCDVSSIKKAQEFAIEQRNGTVRPIHVMGSSRMLRVVNETVPSSSRQNFLPIPGKFSDFPRSSASSSRKGSTKSNDSAFGESPANPGCLDTSFESDSYNTLDAHNTSFDSGWNSKSNSPTKKDRSSQSIHTVSPTHSDVTVINKNSGAGSVANIADLSNLEPKSSEVKSGRGMRFHRGESVPPYGKVLSIMKVEEGIMKVKAEKRRSLDDVRVKI